MIPFARPWVPEASKRYVAEALDHGRVGRSRYYHDRCEAWLQTFCRKEFVLLTNSGTMALQCALAGWPEWESVRVPYRTFAATANAVRLMQRKLVIAELLPESHAIHVALHNWVADPEALLVDAAQAFRRLPGIRGDVCGSFFVNKVLTCGEGGFYATNDGARYTYARAYQDHGRINGGYTHDRIGANGHLADLNAAFLLGQLESWEERAADIQRQRDLWGATSDWSHADWCVLVHDPTGERFDRLRKNGIDVRKDFPSLSSLKAFQGVPTEGTHRESDNLLLPAWHGIPKEAIDKMRGLL